MRPENEPCRLRPIPHMRLATIDGQRVDDESAGERAVEQMNRSVFWSGVFRDLSRPSPVGGDAA